MHTYITSIVSIANYYIGTSYHFIPFKDLSSNLTGKPSFILLQPPSSSARKPCPSPNKSLARPEKQGTYTGPSPQNATSQPYLLHR
uniref:Uncharacterized protein n=1 Tax=Salix viminalis TaxID=40686 RepID=A0A6N2KNT7_SALVM